MAFDLDVRAEGRIDEVQDFLEGGRGELSAQAPGFTGRMAGIKSNERDIVIFREFGENFWQRSVVVDKLAGGPCGRVRVFRSDFNWL